MKWAVVEEAPDVEVVDAAFAISSESATGCHVMKGRTLAKAYQDQSAPVWEPSLVSPEKIVEVSKGQ